MKLKYVIVAFLSSVPLLGESLTYYKQSTETVVGTLRAKLISEGDLTPAETKLIKAARISVPNQWAVQGFASRDANGEEVTIYAGGVAFLDWLAEALVLGALYGDSTFDQRYTVYAAGVIERNTRYHKMGDSTRIALAAPGQAVKDGLVSSSKINVSSAIPGEAQEFKVKLVEASITYLVFHEFGHIALKHLGTDNLSLEDRRAQETAADEWAVVHALRCGVNLSIAIPMFRLFGSVDNEAEKFMDHPAGLKRVINTLESIKRELRSGGRLAKVYKEDGMFDKVISDLDMQINMLKATSAP